MKGSRQTTLGPEQPSPFANHRVVRKPLLSATTLAAWWVCHTRPFLQRVLQRLGIDTSTAAMRAGAAAHAQMQGAIEAVAAPSDETLAQALLKRSFLIQNELHLLDEARRLHGYADIVYARNGVLNILELKNSRPPTEVNPVWRAPIRTEHGVQLHVYGAVAQTMFGQTPRLYLNYLQGGSKQAVLNELESSRDPAAALQQFERGSVHISSTLVQRTMILNEARNFFRAENEIRVPAPNHASPLTCRMCGVKTWCPQRLDQPGQFTPLDGARLEALDPPAAR